MNLTETYGAENFLITPRKFVDTDWLTKTRGGANFKFYILGKAIELIQFRPCPYCNFSAIKMQYRSISLFQSPREWRKYFKLSEVRHKQNVTSPQFDVHVQFLQDILLQYMCCQTLPTENGIEMNTKEIHFSLLRCGPP